MGISLSQTWVPGTLRFGIRSRIATIAAVLTIETVLLSLLIQASITEPAGLAGTVHDIQHWLFRFLIAYAVSWVMLLSLRSGTGLAAMSADPIEAPMRPQWLVAHAALLVPPRF